MLTRNLWTEAGLCNGTMSTIKEIIFSENHTSPMLPIAIIVQFDSNYIGPSFCEDTPNCVPICPVTSSSTSLGNNLQRIQFPLKLAWSMTIHKSQGLTLEKCWIDLGTSERVAGLTYVALSRVHVIEPVTFDRLHSLKKKSNYKCRVLEEARLERLAQDTLRKHSEKKNKVAYILFSYLTVENGKLPKSKKENEIWDVVPSHLATFFLFCK